MQSRCSGNRPSTGRVPTWRAMAGASSFLPPVAPPISSATCTSSRPSGGEPYKITFFQHDAFHPRWSPDDEWIAFITNEGGLPQLALLETHGGALRTITIAHRRWKRPMGVLSVTTRDAATGALTPSRIHVTAADGKFYAPEDAYARIGVAGDHLFHQTGRFTVELPVGPD